MIRPPRIHLEPASEVDRFDVVATSAAGMQREPCFEIARADNVDPADRRSVASAIQWLRRTAGADPRDVRELLLAEHVVRIIETRRAA